jgi:hypothetical protein
LRLPLAVLLVALAALPCRALELSCADGVDDDRDVLIDCDDDDCVADAACAGSDWDGDAHANAADCAPRDPATWAVPGEILPLRVFATRTEDEALLLWPDQAAAAGTSVAYDVISGRIEELRFTGAFDRAALFLAGTRGPGALDRRRTPGDHRGWWYLVRAVTPCGAGPSGSGELDADRRFDEAPTHCDDGRDNDGDRLVDCADPQCTDAPECPEDCDNRIDDDADGLIDCADEECSLPACPEFGACRDGRDNDADGLADCDDPDCTFSCDETCDNGADDDADGDVDCADGECASFADCREDLHCTDGLDNDENGSTDCADPACVDAPPCRESGNCGDAADNDLDGLTDCDDPDCTSACPEYCTNGIDDDADGAIDCFDAECQSDHACCDWCGMAGATIAPQPACAQYRPLDTCYRRFLSFTATAGRVYGFSTCGRCGGSAAGDTILRIHAFGCATAAENDECPASVVGESELLYRATSTGTLVVEVFSVSDADPWVLGYWLGTTEPTSGDCVNGVDDDGDTLIDCLDGDCAADPGCPEDCTNAADDDLDGDTDCADAGCDFDPACAENCGNGLDDDGDGLTDCADGACLVAPACPERACTNGLDDDADGRIDCTDFDCSLDPACPENCGDRRDNDGDLLIDCLDNACEGFPGCCESCPGGGDLLPEPVEACRTWSQPFVCATRVAEILLRAGNTYVFSTCPDTCNGSASSDTVIAIYDDACIVRAQNDDSCSFRMTLSTVSFACTQTGLYRLVAFPFTGGGPFRVGYRITTCGAMPECLEAAACADGADNDGNGLTDCDDPPCASTSCAEAGRCADGVDNDTDAFVDCDDLACLGDPACP